MDKIRIDAATRDKLSQFREEVHLVDDEGLVLGTFRPLNVPPYDESLIPPMSREELERRLSQPGGRTLDEILKDLKDSAA